MAFSRIKYFLEDVLDKVAWFFVTIVVYVLFAVFILISAFPVIILIVAGYAVFAVTTFHIDPLVKVIVFALYSLGLFIFGGILGFKGCSNVKEEIRAGLDMCEKKAASISAATRRCGRNVRKVVDAYVYDMLMCIDAIRKKL